MILQNEKVPGDLINCRLANRHVGLDITTFVVKLTEPTLLGDFKKPMFPAHL